MDRPPRNTGDYAGKEKMTGIEFADPIVKKVWQILNAILKSGRPEKIYIGKYNATPEFVAYIDRHYAQPIIRDRQDSEKWYRTGEARLARKWLENARKGKV